MKHIAVILATSLAMLSAACQHPTGPHSDQNYTRITEENIAIVIGKRLELNGNHIVISDDGTFAGTWNNAPIAGTWEMRDDFWCRVLTEFFDTSREGIEDCHLIENAGNSVRGTRDRGTGNSYIYQLK